MAKCRDRSLALCISCFTYCEMYDVMPNWNGHKSPKIDSNHKSLTSLGDSNHKSFSILEVIRIINQRSCAFFLICEFFKNDL